VTPDQLSAIRARLDAMSPGPWNWKAQIYYANNNSLLAAGNWGLNGPRTIADAEVCAHAPTDLRALLGEVEHLTSDLAMARQVSGELCEACGWAMKFPGEPCRCELLKWRDEWEVFKTHTMEQGTSSFARGAEAMRTALLQRVSWGSDLADRIRTEPVPENK
jgi:hypothetical protein